MENKIQLIETDIGTISVQIKANLSNKTPLILLHGVYFDHHLWDNLVKNINDRVVVTVDMPLHGESRKNIKTNWTLDDCATMLIQILDNLKLEKVVAVGHSWGAMTILRAAYQNSTRFEAVGFCNMPFHAASRTQKVIFWWQHWGLLFRNFYINQAAKALFDKESLRQNPNLTQILARSMRILTTKQVEEIDHVVILNANDSTDLIRGLKTKALALKGKTDYVPSPPFLETILVEGGHVSPLEQPSAVQFFVEKLLN